MPVYNWACTACGRESEGYVPLISTPDPLCQCGAPTEKVWRSHRSSSVSSVFPYVTRNILPNGDPVEVKSARHLDELCRQNNVTHRPDAAWVEKRFDGVDPRTKKPRYREGSGMGLPGSWF